jgi:hypothetical protein
MILNISAVLLFGAASGGLGLDGEGGGGAAIVLFLFGFFAAGTGAYEPIHNLVQACADAVNDLG